MPRAKNTLSSPSSPAETARLIARATELTDQFEWHRTGAGEGANDSAADTAALEDQLAELLSLTATLEAQLAITKAIEEARRLLSVAGAELPLGASPELKTTILSRQVCAFLFLASAERIEPLDVLGRAKDFYLAAKEDAGLR
jgi:hypothetical protein